MFDPNVAASALLVSGAFNVNSRSVEAWVAVLGGARGAAMLSPNASTSVAVNGLAIPRTVPSLEGERGNVASEWSGFARLTDAQVRTLAERLVEQITLRQAANGRPFFSLAEFINRSLTDDALGRKGALQAAIDAAALNSSISGVELTSALQSSAELPFSANGTGNTASAATGWIRQADLLQQVGPFLSARSDTFVVRVYGENVNPATGVATGRAWCEAMVQRVPDFVDPADPALAVTYPGSTVPAGSAARIDTLNTNNTRFGRRIQVVSFRWLAPEDI